MKSIAIAFKMIVVMTLLLGIAYPLAVTMVSTTMMHHHAEGSLIIDKGKIIGSELIGQNFTKESYFWSRPSDIDYDPLKIQLTDLGPTGKQLIAATKERTERFKVDPAKIPPDLVYASASGLDPDISLEAAYFQIERVAKARHIADPVLLKYFIDYIAADSNGNYVNVLKLNHALDKKFPVEKS